MPRQAWSEEEKLRDKLRRMEAQRSREEIGRDILNRRRKILEIPDEEWDTAVESSQGWEPADGV